MTFAARKNIFDDPLQRQTSSDDLLLQITVVHHYIEYNVSAARHSSNIAYTRNIVSMWNFISCMTEIEEIEAPRKTRGQITECRDFFSRLDHIAHYCCADSWRIATEKAREKEASMKNIRRAASLSLHFSTSKLLPRCRPRGTLNVRIGKKVTERNSLGVPRWTFTKISNQKSKTPPSCVPMKNSSYVCRKM